MILVKFSQPENALEPMLVTLLGMLYVPDFAVGQVSKVSIFLSNNTPSSDEKDGFLGSTINSDKLLQAENAKSSIVVKFFGIFMLVKLLQLVNAETPILVRLSGKTISVKLLQSKKATYSISVTLSGITTLVKLLQPANVEYPMLVTPSGITMLFKLLQ